jgi:hypothetical protein
MKTVFIDGKVYTISKSRRKNKKYDVYSEGRYITSFGHTGYQHYRDQIGYYRDLDHNSRIRRELYRVRHRNTNIRDPSSSAYWSWHYLW